MTDTLLRQVALVSESAQVKASDLTQVSAALQKQATRDLVQFWNVKATVDAFPRLEDVVNGAKVRADLMPAHIVPQIDVKKWRNSVPFVPD